MTRSSTLASFPVSFLSFSASALGLSLSFFSSASFTSAYSSFVSLKRSQASFVKNIPYTSRWTDPPWATDFRPSRLLNQSIAFPPRIHFARSSLNPLRVRFAGAPLPSARTTPTSPGAMPGIE